MADSDNFDILPSAGALTGTCTIPIKYNNFNNKTTVSAIGTYVAGAGLALTGSFAGSLIGTTSETYTPTIVTTTGTFDGTNNTATFNAADESLVLFGTSSTRWIIIANVGAVALSAV